MVKTDATEIATEEVKMQESRREAQLCDKPDAWISKPQKPRKRNECIAYKMCSNS